MNGALNYNQLNTSRLNNSGAYPYSLAWAMRQQRDAQPITTIEYISPTGVTYDISAYYLSGANFEQIKERAPDEIQAGSFDIVLSNASNYFSEFDPSSLFYTISYHGATIKVYEGFLLPDGTEVLEIQAVGFIDQLTASDSESTVTLRCRDRIRKLLDRTIHARPTTEVAAAAGGNVGTGLCSIIETKPFKTKNETWTLTCTTPGADGVAIFSVVGSVTGAKGNATSGTQFSTGTGTGGIKFTLTGGGVNWSIGDIFTFTTKQYPEWSAVNVAKIIWSILTGYNWDAGTAEAWSAQVLDLDHTKSDANTDIDYNSFVTAVADIATIGSFNMTGYVGYDELAVTIIQDLTTHFLGSVYTGADGRIKIKTYVPNSIDTATVVAQLSDAKKISKLGYLRTVDEVINYVSVHYKKTNVFQFSDEAIVYDGNFVALDQDSIDLYDFLTFGFSSKWYSTNGTHAQDLANRLIGKYSAPPLNVDLVTGLDAMLTEIGDVIEVTDTKYNLDATRGEVSRIRKNLDDDPVTITLRLRRDTDLGITYGFLGSSANEGDGLSPQSGNWDTASATDLTFCYLGETGHGTPTPDYRMF